MLNNHAINELQHILKVKESWGRKELNDTLERMRERFLQATPELSTIEVGDMFTFSIIDVPHPAVVIKAGPEYSYAVILSSQEDKPHNIMPYKIRGDEKR